MGRMGWFLIRPDALTVLRNEMVVKALNRYFKVVKLSEKEILSIVEA